MLGAPAASQADTYCVGVFPPNCDHTENANAAGLQSALSDADNDGQSDIVLVAGTTIQAPAGGFVYNGPDDIQLRGSEAGVTTIVGPAGPSPALNVTASGSDQLRGTGSHRARGRRGGDHRVAAREGVRGVELTGPPGQLAGRNGNRGPAGPRRRAPRLEP